MILLLLLTLSLLACIVWALLLVKEMINLEYMSSTVSFNLLSYSYSCNLYVSIYIIILFNNHNDYYFVLLP